MTQDAIEKFKEAFVDQGLVSGRRKPSTTIKNIFRRQKHDGFGLNKTSITTGLSKHDRGSKVVDIYPGPQTIKNGILPNFG
jgi:hypothetical protein